MINHLWFDIQGFRKDDLNYRNAILGGEEIIYEDDEGKVHTIVDDRPDINAVSQYSGSNLPVFYWDSIPVYLLPFKAYPHQQPEVIVVPT